MLILEFLNKIWVKMVNFDIILKKLMYRPVPKSLLRCYKDLKNESIDIIFHTLIILLKFFKRPNFENVIKSNFN